MLFPAQCVKHEERTAKRDRGAPNYQLFMDGKNLHIAQVKITGKSRHQTGRELLEAIHIRRNGPACVSHTSFVLHTSELSFFLNGSFREDMLNVNLSRHCACFEVYSFSSFSVNKQLVGWRSSVSSLFHFFVFQALPRK